MTACEAIRQIQLGSMTLDEFQPPTVFTSGAYERYGVTLADLRWHLDGCTRCADMANAVRAEFQRFDASAFDSLAYVAKRIIESTQAEIANLEEWQRAEEEQEANSDPEAAEGALRWPIRVVRLAPEEAAEEDDDLYDPENAHSRAIALHAAMGEVAERWVETLLPPAAPRTWVYYESGQQIDIRAKSIVPLLARASEFRLLCLANPEGAKCLLRCLLLREAFGDAVGVERFWRDIENERLAPLQKSIRWETVWTHYSLLADAELSRLSDAPRGSALPRTEFPTACIEQALQKLGIVGQAAERIESLWEGQTAMMGILGQIDRAAGQLLAAYERSPDRVKASCDLRLREILGPLLDRLTEDTRRELLAAEYSYQQRTEGIELSPVVLCYTKAFEAEFKHAVVGLNEPLAEAANRLQMRPGPPTLGYYKKILAGDGREDLREPLRQAFREHGLTFDAVRAALTRVNSRSDARHLAHISEREASEFRALFLGEPSVLACLLPHDNHNVSKRLGLREQDFN